MTKSNIANKDIKFNAINLDGIGKIVTVNTRDFQSLDQCLFQSFFFGGGNSPPQNKLTMSSRQTAAKLCALNLSFRPGQRITNMSQKHSSNKQ